jgi:hypothetical protein
VLTLKRPQVDHVQYPRIPSKILKRALHGEVVDDVEAEVVMSRTIAGETMKICKS